MKLLFLTIILFVTTSCFSQFPNELEAFTEEAQNTYKLQTQLKQQTRQSKQRFLRKMYKDTSYSLGYGMFCYKTFQKYWASQLYSMYLKDFDSDGDNDILYFGKICPAYESRNVILYLNTDTGYVERHLGGYINDITQDSTGYTIITTFSFPGSPSLLTKHQISSTKPDDIELIANEQYGYHPKDSLIKIDTLITTDKETELFLGANPDRSFLTDYPTKPGIEDIDLMGIIPKNTPLHAYNKVVIEGKTWYYVVIDLKENNNLKLLMNDDFYGPITKVRSWICIN